ncbi:dihydrofolate reductase [Candidatus Spongiihabitans sp.]|uniref:dihydrofolate reductase n=1 Tax=Candidatus Spongiihabitans sp. TaxID=3101308 RepID=UPI003C6EC681
MDQAHTPIRGAIAAMTRENVIGLGGKIPWHYSEDLKRFKRVTLDCTIIMGRLTWESIGCRPLPRRRNIVIGQNPTNNNPVNTDPANHVEHFRSIERAIDACAGENVWIIGGGQIYSAIFSWLRLLDITYVPDVIQSPNATRFPDIDPNQWQTISTTPITNSPLINVIYGRK